ncbi:MAG: hypothetical protein V3S20_04945 [Dehalococcoidia bacterium]
MVGLHLGSKSRQSALDAGLRVGTVEEVAREANISELPALKPRSTLS